MPNIQTSLREEISRLARKELRREVDPLRKLVASYRSTIAQLRQRISALEKRAKAGSKDGKRPAEDAAAEDDGPQLRFSAKGFATLRKKLGLTASEMGALLGVSSLTIYNWEHGKTRPRASQLPAIASARSLGKKEARARLEATASGAPAKAARGRRASAT